MLCRDISRPGTPLILSSNSSIILIYHSAVVGDVSRSGARRGVSRPGATKETLARESLWNLCAVKGKPLDNPPQFLRNCACLFACGIPGCAVSILRCQPSAPALTGLSQGRVSQHPLTASPASAERVKTNHTSFTNTTRNFHEIAITDCSEEVSGGLSRGNPLTARGFQGGFRSKAPLVGGPSSCAATTAVAAQLLGAEAPRLLPSGKYNVWNTIYYYAVLCDIYSR